MRLRDLDCKFAILHPNFLCGPEVSTYFDSVSSNAVSSGYFDQCRFIDIHGNEYSVSAAIVLKKTAFESIQAVMLGSGIRLDFTIALQKTHHLKSLKGRLLDHLKGHPDWWHNNDENWIEANSAPFASSTTVKDVICKIGWYSAETV